MKPKMAAKIAVDSFMMAALLLLMTYELIGQAAHEWIGMADRTNGALEPTIYPILTAWGFTTGGHQVPSDKKIKELLNKVGYSKVIQKENTVQLPDGMMLDLGAVGKGCAGDIIAGMLRENGISSALLDIGSSNIQVIGGKPDGSDWRLGLRDPFGEGNVGVLTVRDAAVVTPAVMSGTLSEMTEYSTGILSIPLRDIRQRVD